MLLSVPFLPHFPVQVQSGSDLPYYSSRSDSLVKNYMYFFVKFPSEEKDDRALNARACVRLYMAHAPHTATSHVLMNADWSREPGLTRSHAHACGRLPWFEDKLARGELRRSDALDTYERLLQQCGPMRHLMDSEPETYGQRVRTLGMNLCATTTRLFGNASAATDGSARVNASATWEAWMAELWRHETDPKDCERFHNFHALGWNPAIFTWPNHLDAVKTWQAYLPLRKAPSDRAILAAAAGGAAYGPPTVRIHTCMSGLPCLGGPRDKDATQAIVLQPETVTMASHFDLLRRAAGLQLERTQLLVEFGGGTGQLSVVARAAGMRGLHVVYDLPFMLLSQRYWLRHVGVPAYLVPQERAWDTWERAAAADAGGPPTDSVPTRYDARVVGRDLAEGREAVHRVALVSSLSSQIHQEVLPRLLLEADKCRQASVAEQLPQHLQPRRRLDGEHAPQRGRARWAGCAAGDTSLFIATWSFSEASYSARAAVRPVLPRFDRLFIRYRDSFDHMDNRGYLIRMVLEDFVATHSVCMWSHHLLMVRRSVGVARCMEDLGCNNRTIDSKLVGKARSKQLRICEI